MNQLSREKRADILRVLCEGNSIRATSRILNVSKCTILKLIKTVGQACYNYHREHVKDLYCKRIQCDEIWSFCYAKERNLPEDKKGKKGYGNVWTWVAICVDTRFVPAWRTGNRDFLTAIRFLRDLASRVNGRIQLTTDRLHVYPAAVRFAFEKHIDYAMLEKIFAYKQREHRYSPAQYVKIKKKILRGNPKDEHISTSCIERNNLTLRMCLRRLTRLTNGFSKKIENLHYSFAIHFMNYNFCRIHQGIGVTPAMKIGISKRLWTLEDVVDLAYSK